MYLLQKKLDVSTMYSDNSNMKAIKELIPILKGVLLDYRVIATFLGFLFFIMIAGFIVNYTKRPPRPKKKRGSAPVQAPKPEPAEAPAEETEEEVE